MNLSRAMRRWSAVLLAGCLSTAGSVRAQDATEQTDHLLVVRRGWHIDVGFAVDELADPLNSVAADFPGVRYLLFGFGDRRYLTAKHRGAPVLLRALGPGPALLLVTALLVSPTTAFGASSVVSLRVPRAQFLRAQSFVWQSLTEGQHAALLSRHARDATPIGIPGPYAGSEFFPSPARYSAVHTCNTWAAELLGSTGIPVRSRRVIFAGQLWSQVETSGARGTAPR